MNSKYNLKLFVVFCKTFATVSDVAKKDIKTYGLSLSEFGAIELLYHKGPQTVQDIGRKVLLTSGSMTYVVDQLVKKELVIRNSCENDRRITYVALSNKGRLLLDEIFPLHEQQIAEIFSSLTENEIISLTENLKRISKSISDKGDE